MSEIKRPVRIVPITAAIECGDGLTLHCEAGSAAEERMLAREVAACINLAPKLAASLRQAVYSESESKEMEAEIRTAALLLAEWDREISKGK